MNHLAEQLRRRAHTLRTIRPGTGTTDAELMETAADLLDQAIIVPVSAQDAFRWMAAERVYQVQKYGFERDDANAAVGFVEGSWWPTAVQDRVHRAIVLGGSHTENGRQAIAKVATTCAGMLEAYMRVEGRSSFPDPGKPSGT